MLEGYPQLWPWVIALMLVGGALIRGTGTDAVNSEPPRNLPKLVLIQAYCLRLFEFTHVISLFMHVKFSSLERLLEASGYCQHAVNPTRLRGRTP